MTVSEFAIQQEWQADRRGPARWILSHALTNKLLILGVFIGAFGNAALAAATPVLTGRAFDAVAAAPPDLRGVATAAGLVAVTQLVRGIVLQLLRNLCSETIGQKLERDVRNELYASLIGKSMSFHDTQATGDLMARVGSDTERINNFLSLNLIDFSSNIMLVILSCLT